MTKGASAPDPLICSLRALSISSLSFLSKSISESRFPKRHHSSPKTFLTLSTVISAPFLGCSKAKASAPTAFSCFSIGRISPSFQSITLSPCFLAVLVIDIWQGNANSSNIDGDIISHDAHPSAIKTACAPARASCFIRSSSPSS